MFFQQQFSSNEAVSLEKQVKIKENVQKTPSENIDYEYDIDNCAKWILDNKYNKVCLQFPDYLIKDSGQVVRNLEQKIENKVYILGDTAYESCCIDFISAQHVNADAIIHFGKTCFSRPEKIIPFLKIYSKHKLNVEELCKSIEQRFKDSITIILDTPFVYIKDEILGCLNDKHTVISVEEFFDVVNNETYLYIGDDDRKIINIRLTSNVQELYICNPNESYSIKCYELDSKLLKRRYFLMEKIKDSSTVGIVIGTLAVKNYLKILERIKSLVKLHEKKYYIISVGKPTVAKLANFPEVDIYVVIGCAMNEIYENREFYKPIVTPYDVEVSLNPRNSAQNFSYDFNSYQTNNEITPDLKNEITESDVSLITGKIRSKEEEITNHVTEENQLVIRTEGKLVSSSFGAGFLAGRSWQGLEQNLGQDEPQMAQEGRKGIAYGYENENK